MKSIGATILMFIGVFGILWLGALDVLNSEYFVYVASIMFFLVILTAVLVVGCPSKKDFINALKIYPKHHTKELTDGAEQKGEKNEKN